MSIRTPSLGGKLTRKVLSMPLAAVLAVGCTPLPAFAAGSAGEPASGLAASSISEQVSSVQAQVGAKSSLYTRYRPVLVDAEEGSGDFKADLSQVNPATWAPTYTVFDIGYDGTPELLVRTDSDSTIRNVHVYTVKSGSLSYLGSFQEPSTAREAGAADGSLYFANWGQGASSVNQVVIEDGAVKAPRVMSGEATNADPGGDVRAVTDYLSARQTSWLSFSGVGNYSVLSEKAKFALAKGTVKVEAAGAYTGVEKKPGVTVTFNGSTLSEGTDYNLSYANNVNAGTATATVTGINDYQGTASSPFAIARADINAASLAAAPAGTYTGAAKTPAVTAKVGDAVLKQGSDFQVAYKNNVNAGTATATVAGQGNYAGTKSVPFAIAKANISAATLSAASGGAYTGAAKTPAVTARIGSLALRSGSDYRVAYKNNVNAGTATATVTGQGNFTGSKAVAFSIAKANISAAAVSVASGGTYTGSAKTPKVSVKLGKTALAQGSAFSVAYKNNKSAGKATATITGKGNYTGSKAVAFSIAKAPNTMALKSSDKTFKAATVAKAAQTFKAITLSKKAYGKVTYKNASSSAVAKKFSVNSSTGAITVKKGTAKGTYSVKVQATAAGDGNHSSLSKTTTVKVVVK